MKLRRKLAVTTGILFVLLGFIQMFTFITEITYNQNISYFFLIDSLCFICFAIFFFAKKNIKTVISFLLIPIIVFISTWAYFFIELEKGEKVIREACDPTTEIGKANIELRKQIRKEMEHEIKGDEYLKQGEYELAIEEFKKVPSAWLSHSWLADTYEKAGRYEETIGEIDWLISQNPRLDVVEELTQRKQKLQELLKK